MRDSNFKTSTPRPNKLPRASLKHERDILVNAIAEEFIVGSIKLIPVLIHSRHL